VSGSLFVIHVLGVIAVGGTVMLVQLLGSIRTFEFMAFTGNTRQRNGHKKQGKNFHRRAS
jgi:hypothetical protein